MAPMWLAEVLAQMGAVQLEVKKKTVDVIHVIQVRFQWLVAPAPNVALANIRLRRVAIAPNASREPCPSLQELQSVTSVQQANMKSVANRAMTAQLDLFHWVGMIHVPNAQLDPLRPNQAPQLVNHAWAEPLLLQVAVPARSALQEHIL